MAYNQKEYTKKYQKENYKMYQFRVKKSDEELIKTLDELSNRNSYIVSLLKNNLEGYKKIYTISQIKKIILPILSKYGIKDVYLFGSYARGEANENSDVDIFCDQGNIKSLFVQAEMEDLLREKLKKDVDVVYIGSSMDETFEKTIKEDLIKLC